MRALAFILLLSLAACAPSDSNEPNPGRTYGPQFILESAAGSSLDGQWFCIQATDRSSDAYCKGNIDDHSFADWTLYYGFNEDFTAGPITCSDSTDDEVRSCDDGTILIQLNQKGMF